MQFVVGIDIGGTCTDCVVVTDRGDVILGKAFSTPPDFSSGIIDSLEVAGQELGVSLRELLAGTQLLLHSTTIAENAVINGDLATVGLLTTRGFEDTLFITRGGYGRWSGLTEDEKRDPVYTEKPEPIVPRSRILGIRERTIRSGERLVAAEADEIATAVRELVARGAESLGVCFLWSFINPDNERLAGDVIRDLYPDHFLTLSHEVAPVLGEYERTSTVGLNGALGPVVRRYLASLQSRLEELGFRGTVLVAQAYGGLLPVGVAADRPVGLIESGPVSGVLGAKALGEKIGLRNIIAADMGGTSFKVGVIRESLMEYQREPMLSRYHFALPKMDVVSLGLAGGSIISIDQRTGLPQAGPKSASSYPGPVCYDHGGEEPTVTDVDAILGYLNPSYFLGGRESLNIDRARRIFKEKIADPLGLDTTEAAAAIYKLANSMIYDLLHKVTIENGLDPRRYALFSFGGTAGMHVASYADELGVGQIVVPNSASVHGAFGLVTSDIVHEDQITNPVWVPADPEHINAVFEELMSRATRQLKSEGFMGEDVLLQRSVDMRYRRQVHVMNVPVERSGPLDAEGLEQTVDHFEALYKGKYGNESAFREAGMEMSTFRVRATGLVKKPELSVATSGGRSAEHALVERRPAYVRKAGAVQEVPGYDFASLLPGNEIQGPAIVWSPITTIVLDPDQTARMDGYKNLVITRNA
jgi:N-methylhydantoinase A